MFLAGFRPVVVPDGCLLAVGIPLVFPVQLPAKEARLVLSLVRTAAQDQGVLLPDAAAGQVEARVLEGLAEVQPLGICVEYIDGSILLHVLFHIDESRKEELVELIVRHVIVLDLASCFFHIDVIGWIRQHHVGLFPGHQPFIGFRQRRIATDDNRFYVAELLDGLAARKAGMNIPHTSAKLLMKNKRYIGDAFYPAIISKDIFDQAEEERQRRAASLGRLNLQKKMRSKAAATSFHWHKAFHHYENPKQQAEYLYSLIESEGVQ